MGCAASKSTAVILSVPDILAESQVEKETKKKQNTLPENNTDFQDKKGTTLPAMFQQSNHETSKRKENEKIIDISEEIVTDKNEEKKTEEQVKEEKLQKIKDYWKESFENREEILQSDKKVVNFAVNSFNSHFALNKKSIAIRKQYKKELYVVLGETKAQNIVVEHVAKNLDSFSNLTEDTEDNKTFSRSITLSFSFLTNLTDSLLPVVDDVMKHPTFMRENHKFLEKMADPHISSKDTVNQRKALKSLTAIMHNLAMKESNVAQLQEMKFVDVLKLYLKSPVEEIKISVLAALADILKENECDVLNTDKEALDFLKRLLSLALNQEGKSYKGWSAWELTRTIRRISRNDTNKRSVVTHGFVPVLIKFTDVSDENKDIEEALSTLRTLAFDKENQNDFISMEPPNPVDLFIKFSASPDKSIKKICDVFFWTMREKLVESRKYKSWGEKITVSSPAKEKETDSSSKGHVMLSYQWSYQNIVKQIRDVLKQNGFKVWMDVDDMGGSTVDAMAKAVENADAVLICFSQTYKDSDNCRAEAEYAFQKKKKFIPLKMERGYQADGWLGFILGAKLFFDFGGKYTFESRMEGLIRELQQKLNTEIETPIVPSVSTEVSSKPVSSHMDSVDSRVVARKTFDSKATDCVTKWTKEDVNKWVTKHQLPQNKFDKVTGIEIAFLHVLLHESPEFFYKTITDTLGIKDLMNLARLRFALDDLN